MWAACCRCCLLSDDCQRGLQGLPCGSSMHSASCQQDRPPARQHQLREMLDTFRFAANFRAARTDQARSAVHVREIPQDSSSRSLARVAQCRTFDRRAVGGLPTSCHRVFGVVQARVCCGWLRQSQTWRIPVGPQGRASSGSQPCRPSAEVYARLRGWTPSQHPTAACDVRF